MILIGTSGYDYTDWREFFYPADLPREEFLAFYSNYFSALELNFSYYSMPSASALARMVEKSGGRLVFSIKAHRSMTHERVAGNADLAEFNEALSPLREAGKLGAVLLQFPHSFRASEDSRRYIHRLKQAIDAPLVAEFRSGQWTTPAVYKWLNSIGVAFCCVDEPDIEGLMPRVALSTASPAYVRFHGRNAEKWYTHNQAFERYDYRYSVRELAEWVPLIERLDKSVSRTLVFFNNHFQAKAVGSARSLCDLLRMTLNNQKTRVPDSSASKT